MRKTKQTESITVKEVDHRAIETVRSLVAIHAECFKDSAPEPYIQTPGAHWWIAYTADGTEAGFAGLVSEFGVTGYLIRAGVLKAFRGRGIQRRLIEAREKKARQLGLKVLRSDTCYNTPSSNNLISAGFKLFDPITPWGLDDSLYWYKRL